MKKTMVSFISATALLTAGMVFASDNLTMDDYQLSAYYQHEQNEKFYADSKVGFFIGINAGYAKVKAFTKSKNTGFAWNANLGYQFSPYFAIESGYTQFPDVNESGTLSGVGAYTAKDKYYGIDLLFKGILPVTHSFDLFAKLGAMYFTAQRKLQTGAGGLALYKKLKRVVTQYNPEVGIGASYDITPHVAITVQGIGTFWGYSTYAGYGGLSFKFN